MTGNHVVDLTLITLGPLIVWRLYWAHTRHLGDPEALVLGALCVAPKETLTEAQLQRITDLSEPELAAALDHLRDRLQRTGDQVTLR